MGSVGELRMVRKKQRSQSSCVARIERLDMGNQEIKIGSESYELLHFPILELPMHIIYDILSRLPLNSFSTCILVCKVFLKILKDPYFAQVHLGTTPVTVNVILQKCMRHSFCMSRFMLDCDHVLKVSSSSSSSIDGCQGSIPKRTSPYHSPTLTEQNTEKCFVRDSRPTIVGYCHGLLCMLYVFSEDKPIYCICNPINGVVDDYVAFRYLPPSYPSYSYLNLSGFAYCPKTKVYKLIRFTAMPSHDPKVSVARGKTVVEIYTVGSDSWRRIYGVPSPKLEGSFDPYLNGFYHWLAVSNKPSQLICSLDLEKECFGYIPPPEHLSIDYYNKISWINIGTLNGRLCICYVLEHAYFEVWVMEEYGVMESWKKEFKIDFTFYTDLKEEDLQRPLKFLDNGDLWLHCRTHYLVSYSPRNRTFKIFDTLGQLKTDVTMHFPSFLSPKLELGGNLQDCPLTFYLPTVDRRVF